jgi:alkylation response protein AidB-like acyl-CoA dehydrogenase
MDGGGIMTGLASGEDCLALVSAEAAALAPLAAAVDREGIYPEERMTRLGAAGAFGLHLAGHTSLAAPSLTAAIEAMAIVSAECMSTGFCMWCQDSAGWYLEHSANADLRARLQPDIAAGRLKAGTGLSNPVKAMSGTESFRLRGERVTGGYVVTGVLPWVSNLGDGHWLATVFELADTPQRRVMAMLQIGQDGISLKRNAQFIALEGTATYSVLVRQAFLPDELVLADPVEEIMPRIKPGFIMLQTGMGLGVTDAAARLMREADRTQGHCNAHLPLRAAQVEARADALRGRLTALAATPAETSREMLREVLKLRLDVSETCLEAVQAALLHWGAPGYLEGSQLHRRLREAWFVAIITPSIRHLRSELARLEEG